MILCFGTVCLDRLRRIAALPQSGGYAEIQSDFALLGGEASNTACTLSRWGREVHLYGNPVGDDVDGRLIRARLAEAGVPFHCAPAPEGLVTPICEVFVADNGDRTMFGRGFSTIGDAVAPEAAPYRAREWFTADPNFGVPARTAARLAAEAGMKLYLMDFNREDDPIPVGSYWQSSTDWAGVRGDSAANRAWVSRWVDRHGCRAVLTDGANGYVYASPEVSAQHYRSPAPPVVVDSTGAGDGFRAGMLYGLTAGWSIDRCLRFAAAAGALFCTTLGATGRIPDVVEVEALAASAP